MAKQKIIPILKNPFSKPKQLEFSVPGQINYLPGVYEEALEEAHHIMQKPFSSAGFRNIQRQHLKNRMTVWERIKVLTSKSPKIQFQNWGPDLDGASLVTAVIEIEGRDVALYGHDFTIKAGSMDATNGKKLARLYELAGKHKIPLIGMNDSSGAFVPAGVGGLDGYAEAFTSLRKLSGVVPSIMCMFGFNAGGGSYLPRQGSFLIQPQETFLGLTGPGVVKSVLGEDVTAAELGGPNVHSQTGVADIAAEDEVSALKAAKKLLRYLPNCNAEMAPFRTTSDPIDRKTWDIDLLLKKALNSPTGFNTPLDVSIIIEQVCDHGDYFEIQPDRARNTLTCFGRVAGNVVGFVANNSAVGSGQIDIAAAYKNARFIRFCNLYNIPVIFMEDTPGFLPGKEQEDGGIVQAGRAMLDAIIDLRTPRFLLLIRNAIGGAYASYNNYPTGADLVIALPTTRVAVMGPSGVEFVYKDELRALRASLKKRKEKERALAKSRGLKGDQLEISAEAETARWLALEESKLRKRYEKELMNPKEALSLGSVSQLVMPSDLRHVLAENMAFHIRHYQPRPFAGVQREFH